MARLSLQTGKAESLPVCKPQTNHVHTTNSHDNSETSL